MSETPRKMYFFVDESGDPNFFGHHGRDLIAAGHSSKYFIVGHLEIENPNELSKDFQAIRDEIAKDEFINMIPSVKNSLKCFHANKDSREVQERVFKVLKRTEFRFHAAVIEKRADQFIDKWHRKQSELYIYMVERLLEQRLHLYPEIDVYFAQMDSVTSAEHMWKALERAKNRFLAKYTGIEHGNIRIFMQQPHQIAGLQAVDYCLWAIHRVYHHKDFRYFNYLADKVSLVHDLNHGKPLYGTYFSKKNPLTKERFDHG